MSDGNIFSDSGTPAIGERHAELLRLRHLVVERIVSADDVHGQVYRQSQDEWVLLVRGQASIDVDGHRHELVAGDHLFIAAGTRHTVVSTSGGALWLAVHLHPSHDGAGDA